MNTDRDLESRIQDLEAIQEIMNLEADYCFGADNHDSDLYASVFAEDGVLIAGPRGEQRGREAIKAFCRDQIPLGFSFSIHFLHNPRIVVNGDAATGKFYWQASLTHPGTNTATWAAGAYDTEYIKTEEGWKIKKKVVDFFYNTPYDKGWVKERFMNA